VEELNPCTLLLCAIIICIVGLVKLIPLLAKKIAFGVISHNATVTNLYNVLYYTNIGVVYYTVK